MFTLLVELSRAFDNIVLLVEMYQGILKRHHSLKRHYSLKRQILKRHYSQFFWTNSVSSKLSRSFIKRIRATKSQKVSSLLNLLWKTTILLMI